MKQYFYIICLLVVATFGACSTADEEDVGASLEQQIFNNANQSDSIVFEGTYTRNSYYPEVHYPPGPEGGIPYGNDAIVNCIFHVVMSDGNMRFDTQLIEMLTGYKGKDDDLVIPYQLVGSSADNQMVVFGLAVPPFEYEVADAQGYAVRLEFGYGSQAVYNTYTGELTVWLEFAKLYRDGVLYADYTGQKKGFTLLAKRK